MPRRSQSQRHKDSTNEPLVPLLTIADVMRLLQVSRPTIYSLIEQGLPYLKFGRAVRFAPGSIQRFIAQREEIA